MNAVLQSPVSPMLAVRGNIRAKMELFNPGGSHKSRAARHIIRRALASGHLSPGGPVRILEKSGGNFGVGLAYEAAKHGIGVDLVIGLSFSPVKRAICEAFGARLVGIDLLHAGLQPREVITQFLADAPDRYFFTDQFSNTANVDAHLLETGPEICRQIKDDAARYAGIILVVAAGTGASAAGIGESLRRAFGDVRIVLNQPQNCSFAANRYGDHAQLGTAVGVFPPFLDLGLISEAIPVSDADAMRGQKDFARDTGVYPGPSSGGNYHLAQELARRHPDHLVVTLIYDSGEAYIHARKTA